MNRYAYACLSTLVVIGACAKAKDLGDASTGSGGDEPILTGASSGTGEDTESEASTGSGGPSGPTGAGGSDTTTSSAGPTGAGGSGAGSGTSSTSGAGGSAGNCTHDLCTAGVFLVENCDPCVSQVCAADPYCCDGQGGEWDDVCVDEVSSECGLSSCGGGTTASSASTGVGGGGPVGGVGPGDLIITEIMNNPSVVADDKGEWFEVYNTTLSSIDLGGLVVRHQANDPAAVHTIGGSVIVPALGYVVLGANADPTTNGGIAVNYAYTGVNLSNVQDYLAIETASVPPVLIDSTSYDEVSGLDPNGKSRNLDPNFMSMSDNDDDTHFCEASSFVTGSAGDKATPGAANNPCP